MPTYRTPGVYIEEVAGLPPSVTGVATAVPAFIGFTERAIDADGNDLTQVAARITSLQEYERYFGRAPAQDFAVNVTQRVRGSSGKIIDTQIGIATAPPYIPVYLLYYSMQLFFANGGAVCYVVSVGNTSTTAFNAALFVAAFKVLEQCAEPTLYVFPDACCHRPGSAASDMDVAIVVNAALQSCARMQNRFTIADVRNAIPGGAATTADVDSAFRNHITSSSDILKYGAAYFPYLKTRLAFVTADTHIEISRHTVIKIAGNGSESSAKGDVAGGTAISAIADHPEIHNAVYAFIPSLPTVTLPPSGAIAGVYAQVDANRGVWKAPANVALTLIEEPAIAIDNNFSTALNSDPSSGKSINAIRTFAGKGVLVWGARTLAGNDNEWRYISVRRYCNFVEASVKNALEGFVFEPNDANTWVKVRGMIENFMLQQWQQGALMGNKPDEAFYVRVGLNQTMTAIDIANGRMLVEIGIALIRPAEFVVLRILQKIQTS
jgi:phage tail sheath protein FI